MTSFPATSSRFFVTWSEAKIANFKSEKVDEDDSLRAANSYSSRENLCPVDKEGLAIVFGVKKFQQYLYGRHFIINTDHKPLLGLFNEKKQIPQMASPKVQRWALMLAAYGYAIAYKEGKEHANADALSRLPLPDLHNNTVTHGDSVFLMQVLESTPVDAGRIKTVTKRDPTLARVCKLVRYG